MQQSALHMADNWLQAYKQAWEGRSVEKISALFAPDGEYWETPYLVHKGADRIRAYWQAAPLQQDDIRFSYELLAPSNKGVLAHWHANFLRQSTPHELDGIFLIDLDAQGRCLVLREWWHSRSEC